MSSASASSLGAGATNDQVTSLIQSLMPSILLTALDTDSPSVFKSINGVLISSEASVWTPTSGKKFRLLGGYLTVAGGAGAILFKDGVAGSTILTLPAVAIGVTVPIALPGRGKISSTINNVLTLTGVALMVVSGVLWGTEE